MLEYSVQPAVTDPVRLQLPGPPLPPGKADSPGDLHTRRRAAGDLLQRADAGDRLTEALGISQQQRIKAALDSLFAPSGDLLLTEDRRRLLGLLRLEAQRGTNGDPAAAGWLIRHLAIDPEAPAMIGPALVSRALDRAAQAPAVVATAVPATDSRAIAALKANGFRVVAGQTVSVIRPREHPDNGSAGPGLTIVPAGPQQLEAMSRLLLDAPHGCSLLQAPLASANAQAGLIRSTLAGYLHRSDRGLLAALGTGGELLGFLSHRLVLGLQRAAGRRVAYVDHVCAGPAEAQLGIGELLCREAISQLKQAGVDAVALTLNISDWYPIVRHTALRKLGFDQVQSRLLMHRYLLSE